MVRLNEPGGYRLDLYLYSTLLHQFMHRTRYERTSQIREKVRSSFSCEGSGSGIWAQEKAVYVRNEERSVRQEKKIA